MLLALPDGIIDILYLFNHSTSYSSEKELTPYVQLSPVFHSLSFQPIRCRVPSTSSDHGDYKEKRKEEKDVHTATNYNSN